MGSSSQEGRYTKLSALVALVGLIVAYLAWQYPRVPREESQPATQGTPAPAAATVTPAGEPEGDATPSSSPSLPSETPQTPPESGSPQPQGSASPNAGKSLRTCEALEPATLRADSPATVAAGLVTLSITPNQLGSEKFVTLNMASDRESRTEMVLGAPDRELEEDDFDLEAPLCYLCSAQLQDEIDAEKREVDELLAAVPDPVDSGPSLDLLNLPTPRDSWLRQMDYSREDHDHAMRNRRR